MTLGLLFAIASSLVGCAAITPYIRDILLRKTEPHMYSWLIWALLAALTAVTVFKNGGGFGTIQFVVGALICTTVLVLSMRYGSKNITMFDGVALIGAFIALTAYLVLQSPVWSVTAVALTDVLAFMPTFRKAYEEPYTETLSTFVIGIVSILFGLFSLQTWTFVTTLYLLSVLVTNTLCVCMLMIRRRQLEHV